MTSSAPGRARSPGTQTPRREAGRRKRYDRRWRPTPWSGGLRPLYRRENFRRSSEGANAYVDVYQRTDVLMLIAIFTINIADAFFTLEWIGRGGIEGNPVMAWVLDFGQVVFIGLKCLVVGAWLLILIVHKNFALARLGLWGLLVFYSLLLSYHVFLYLFAEPIV